MTLSGAWWSSRRLRLAAVWLLVLAPEAVTARDGSPVVMAARAVSMLQRKLGARLVILEASWDDPANRTPGEYAAERVPGALHLNTDTLENGYPRWHLRPVEELQQTIGGLGIASDSMVVVYSRQTIAAARVWWVLHYAGASDVRVLDGGLAAWKRAGLPVETSRKPSRVPVPCRFAARPRAAALATVNDVASASARGALLADVRSVEEYNGEKSGYSYLAARGRIPGALHAGNADDSARLYQNEDGTLRSPDEIAALWRKALGPGALTGRPEIILYCGTGWRSSLAYLYAHLLRLPNIRNYSDGWSDWSTRFESIPGFSGITPGWRQSPSGRPIESGAATRRSEP